MRCNIKQGTQFASTVISWWGSIGGSSVGRGISNIVANNLQNHMTMSNSMQNNMMRGSYGVMMGNNNRMRNNNMMGIKKYEYEQCLVMGMGNNSQIDNSGSSTAM